MKKKHEEFTFLERDISWLSFNHRVLQEAKDNTVPLLERLKFLSIFSSNLDEFFRVRVASLRRMMKVNHKILSPYQNNPALVIEEIQKTVLKLQEKFQNTYSEVRRELELSGVYIINEKELTTEGLSQLRLYFKTDILPYLFPVIIDDKYELPEMRDKSIYQVISMQKKEGDKPTYAILELPVGIVSRFYVLPRKTDKIEVILLDDMIRASCDILFSFFDYTIFHSYTVKLTRDAELDLDSDLNANLLDKIIHGVKQRKKGQPTRFVYDERIPKEMLDLLIRKLKLSSRGLLPGGRYHNFKDFADFPETGNVLLKYQPREHIPIPVLESSKRMFDAITQGDIIIHHPYQSFDYIIRLMREAAIDPQVRRIYITLYRVAKKSNVVQALINAVKNGVNVTVYMELQARFDEEDNVYWSQKLAEAGATVFYGKPGQKIHAKMCLIERKESGKNRLYGHLGTGNYNRITSRLYCDHGLLTKDPRVTLDMKNIFEMLHTPEKMPFPKHILVAPLNMKNKFLEFIDREIENKQRGKNAYILAKMNSLVDGEIITRLYHASRVGVQVRLIVRGICCLVPGVPDQSENIEVRSIIDRYLEHARIYVFCNGGQEIIYLSSADWMTRNLLNRIETAFPILDKACKKQIREILEIQWKDNVKSRIINQEYENQYNSDFSETPVRAQWAIYDYLSGNFNEV